MLNKMQNKKAIEPVIATVLLIVITIVAVALVVSFVLPFLQKQMQTSQVCYNAKLEIKADESCYNLTTDGKIDYVTVKVTRGAEEFTLSDIILKVSTPTTTKTIRLGPGSLGLNKEIPANPLEEKLYILPSSSLGIATETSMTSVAVAPVVKTGTIEKICEVTSQVAIAPCT